jgi:hypothetical protein
MRRIACSSVLEQQWSTGKGFRLPHDWSELSGWRRHEMRPGQVVKERRLSYR